MTKLLKPRTEGQLIGPDPSEAEVENGISAIELWRHIFGNLTGLMCLWTAQRDGKLKQPRRDFFHYPEQIADAAEHFEFALAFGREVYFCAHLLTEKRRKKESAAELLTLYADGDGAEIPDGFPRPTAIVESSPGRHHYYWRLSESIDPQTAHKLNTRIAMAVGADPSGADLTQLLRVPGTLNHKYAENPEVVGCLVGQEVHDLDDFVYCLDKFGIAPEEQTAVVTPSKKSAPPVALSDDQMDIWHGDRPTLKEGGGIDRSASLYAIGAMLFEAGATEEKAVAALRERDIILGWKKYCSRPDADAQYGAIFEKACTSTSPKSTREAAHDDLKRAYHAVDVSDALSATDLVEPLVSRLLVRGQMTLIGSWVGAGKTTMAQGIVAALIKQTPAFNLLTVEPLTGPIIYLSELSNVSLAQTIELMMDRYDLSPEELDNNFRPYSIGGVPAVEARDEFLNICAGAALVIVDTFDEWLGTNPNKTMDALSGWVVLRDVASQGASVLVFDHSGKDYGMRDEKQTSIAGSSAKQRLPDLVCALKREDEHNLLVPLKDRFGNAISLKLELNHDEQLIATPVDPTVFNASPKIKSAMQFLIDYLTEYGPTRFKVLRQASIDSEHKASTMRRALELLQENQRVQKVERGVYSLVPIGE